jgi:hypothetical protein
MVGPSLENWCLKPSEAILMHEMEFFGVTSENWIHFEGISTSIASIKGSRRNFPLSHSSSCDGSSRNNLIGCPTP